MWEYSVVCPPDYWRDDPVLSECEVILLANDHFTNVTISTMDLSEDLLLIQEVR